MLFELGTTEPHDFSWSLLKFTFRVMIPEARHPSQFLQKRCCVSCVDGLLCGEPPAPQTVL
jgi:hypothetical protein